MIGRKQPPIAAGKHQEPKGFDAFELRLGDIMRGERATLGKSLLDVQRELKIKATYIAAIEHADPTAFETPGFVAGYVRSYARYLGLDPEWAYDAFCREGNFSTVHGMHAAASAPKPGATRSQRKSEAKGDPLADPNATFVPRGEALFSRIEPGAVGSILVLVALIGALGFGGWTVLQQIQRVQLAPVDEAPGVVADVDPLVGADSMDVAENSGMSAPSADALDRLYRPRPLDVPEMVARDGPISTLEPGSLGALVDA
ncbi:MAG: helix-turn-helix domain-containing protein, partial [Paracoccaceae bacterium]